MDKCSFLVCLCTFLITTNNGIPVYNHFELGCRKIKYLSKLKLLTRIHNDGINNLYQFRPYGENVFNYINNNIIIQSNKLIVSYDDLDIKCS